MANLTPLISWFQSHNGSIDLSSIALTTFPHTEGGRGARALKDIPEGHTLFSIPRALSLSTRASSLPRLFGLERWKESGMDRGWVGLILVMMWEGARGGESVWSEYLVSLPTKFDTPMFWDTSELEELRGTSVVEKIGRGDAERDYQEKLLPAIRTRPDLFLPELRDSHYSMEQYHIMGSRILSRSFNVERPDPGDANDEGEEGDGAADTSRGSGMDVDEEPPGSVQNGDEETRHGDNDADGEEEEVDGEDEVEVCMLPMADMLNARYGLENAKLFYEQHSLEMISTRPIKAGDQIWNTYGNLPNAELLRRYGHVDLLPLSQGGEGNPGDVVEVGADLVVDAVSQSAEGTTREEAGERVDWWLEEGGDDMFVFEWDFELPPALISFVRLLTLPQEEWVRTREKGKVPKAKVDVGVLGVVGEVLGRRIGLYPTSIQEDQAMLDGRGVSVNKRHAIVVRVGEKRILESAMERVRALMGAEEVKANGNGKNKRKGGDKRAGNDEEIGSRSKKSRR